MITIEKLKRAYKIRENQYTGRHWICYLETESDFVQGIQNLCNTIGEDNIVSVQFFERDCQIASCIITYKD